MALASFGQVVVGVAGIAKEAYELYKSLKAGFASSAISRSELRAAEDIFENYPLERWDEEVNELVFKLQLRHFRRSDYWLIGKVLIRCAPPLRKKYLFS